MLIFVRENLIMRSLSKNDALNVYTVINENRSYLRTWLPWVDGADSPSVVENVITSWENDFKNKCDVVLGIFENGKYIGNIGLHDINNHKSSGMIGYWLAKNRQGYGITTDCVRALINFGFYMLGLNRITINCAADNMKSRAIPERLGFAQEGTLQDGEHLYGIFHDMIVYGLVKRNWQKSEVLSLITPTLEFKEAALDYRKEHTDNNETHIHGSSGLIYADDYESWLEKIIKAETEAEAGKVKCSTYFAFVNGKIVGTIQIRHALNDDLLQTGGHIGYGVRPSERRKGYASQMLILALEKSRELNIEKALVTCDKNNISSMKTIVKCGGALENEVTEEDGNILQRYWIG